MITPRCCDAAGQVGDQEIVAAEGRETSGRPAGPAVMANGFRRGMTKLTPVLDILSQPPQNSAN
jgi:hypothetical protein